MATLIKERKIATDSWQLLRDGADGARAALPPDGDVIVPARRWLEEREQLALRAGRIGVLLSGDDDPADVAEDLRLFGVVAVDFPRFTDGRGYSIGRLLRERYGWRGEMRAVGDIQRDQLFYLARCGFDAFMLRDGEDATVALGAFQDFSERYQAAVDQPLPLFRRRAAGGQSLGQ
ncbi:MAG: DUF934 domain-containing protein [Rhodospirillaceae bacterium]